MRRQHRWRRAIALAMTAILGVAATAGDGQAGQRATFKRGFVDLRLATPQEAEKIVAVLPDPAATRAPRKAVTDLLLIAGPLGLDAPNSGDIEAALAAPNAASPPQRLFTLRLMAVVAGRLQRHGAAACGGWQNDRSRCTLSCDGSHFDLVRSLTAQGPAFRLLLGGEGLEDGILVSPCDSSGTEVRLAPRAGQLAEIALHAD